MSEIALKSVYDLLEKNYFIPSYQRGYRWEKRQVVDLLDDLCDYMFDRRKNKGDGSFYCLQPIVVKKCDEKTIAENNLKSDYDNNTWYEVIDGQQRLTTIYLLFRYLLAQPGIPPCGKLFRLAYQTHFNDEDCINNPENPNDKTPNAYYITKAYKTIAEWFDTFSARKSLTRSYTIKGEFMTLLTNDDPEQDGCAQVIWYETEEGDPIKTFTRLNIGKIPLNNAELIKALFLQKRDENPSSQVQQIQIAKEWDRIEASLQESRFWAFLNKDLKDIPNHIEFIFDVIFKVEGKEEKEKFENEFDELNKGASNLTKKELLKEREEFAEKKFNDKYGTDDYATFRFFSYKFENSTRQDIDAMWEKVCKYYETFLEWQNDPIWYHYIGFLIYCGVDIIEIYDLYKGKTKTEFVANLKQKIKEWLKVRLKDNEIVSSKNGRPICYSDSDRKKLRQLLLLYNIEYINKKYIKKDDKKEEEDKNQKDTKKEEIKEEENKNQNDYEIEKGYLLFPFDLFKAGRWDIEHVDSFTTNPLTDRDEQKKWLKTALQDLGTYRVLSIKDEKDTISIETKNLKEEEREDAEKLNSFLNDPTSNVKFDDVAWALSKFAGEDLTSKDVEKEIKNSIGNLTLLNAEINRSYGNAIFPTKKKWITEKDAAGVFIPLCTKNVFLKNFSGINNTSISWTEQDMELYKHNILKVIGEFLYKDNEGENNDKKI